MYLNKAHYSYHVVALNELQRFINLTKKDIIMWTTPAATEMRFGFEVTMYVMNK